MTAYGVYPSGRSDGDGGSPPAATPSRVVHITTEVGGGRGEQLFTVRALTDGRVGWKLSGEIDLDARTQFADLLATMASAHGGNDGIVHLDLAELEFIDADDTQALIDTARRLRDTSSARLALHDPPYSLRRIASMLLRGLNVGDDGTLTLP